jgi:3-hydroxy-9,10-secoandrosta-1,3,5(10)-triene-9,17-dione monooxygenase
VSLLGEAQRIAPELEATRHDGDELRRLPDATWKLLQGCGILRSLQPRRWGGGEVHILEFVDAVIELSRANPSAGWVAGVLGVHPWQLALFDEQAQEDMWGADPAASHSSSYMPTGKAERVEGGYKVSGRWSFSSGCDHCRGVMLGAVVRSAESPPEGRSFLLLPGEYRIEDTWFTAGLKSTGSNDIVVEEAIVPEHRSQSHTDYALGARLPGQALNDAPLYRLPFSVVFNSALVSSILGSAKGFIDAWVAETRGRVVAGGARSADDPLIQRRLADALWDLDAATTVTRSVAQRMWDLAVAGEPPTMEERGRMRWDMVRGADRVADACAALFRVASGRTAFLDHPLHARFQDLQAGMGHAFLVPDALARSVGGHLLGAEKQEMVL